VVSRAELKRLLQRWAALYEGPQSGGDASPRAAQETKTSVRSALLQYAKLGLQ
jgi:hypothetical protein